jgi:hypothetical protein
MIDRRDGDVVGLGLSGDSGGRGNTLAEEFGLLLILGEARGRELARESGESVDINVSGLTLSRVGLLLTLGEARGRELAREAVNQSTWMCLD